MRPRTDRTEFGHGFEVSRPIAPATVPAIVLGGILYPLVFATAGRR